MAGSAPGLIAPALSAGRGEQVRMLLDELTVDLQSVLPTSWDAGRLYLIKTSSR